MKSYPKTVIFVIVLLICSVVFVASVYASVSTDSNIIDDNNNDNNDNDNNTVNNSGGSEENILTVTMLPSVDSDYEYKSYTQSWVNYCPFCHKYDTLSDTPKDSSRSSSVPEGEITCDMSKGGCDADYCGVTGKDKLGRNVFLIAAGGSVPVDANELKHVSSHDFDNKFKNRNSQISFIDQSKTNNTTTDAVNTSV